MTYAANEDLCPDIKALHGTVLSPHRRDFLRQTLLLSFVPVAAMLPYQANASIHSTTTAQAGDLIHNRIHFNGASQDTLLGLQHLGEGYRAYNASLQRFHAMDSLSPFNEGGGNAYGYVYGDPVNYNDPSGHRAQWVKRLTTFLYANPAESSWMAAATLFGITSGGLWAASTRADESETVDRLNLIAGSFAALTGMSALGVWVSAKNPLASRRRRQGSRSSRRPSAPGLPTYDESQRNSRSSRNSGVYAVNPQDGIEPGLGSPVGPQYQPQNTLNSLSQEVPPPSYSPTRSYGTQTYGMQTTAF
ncbi:RHS repeat-associated core domain-containing protein [Aeromonas jandaei]|uniref:RHS repeat-associated core domain-containing protein n=1 Tax=Aeromonas jandaei TaxID=650 RepID=UPI001ABF1B10|nr:RHS repeat-associated core domain-containing protein [Aeromonas jandaei]QSR71973.1 RHS repeat-associated core domain-containing protein [Aeromonas jandaei]